MDNSKQKTTHITGRNSIENLEQHLNRLEDIMKGHNLSVSSTGNYNDSNFHQVTYSTHDEGSILVLSKYDHIKTKTLLSQEGKQVNVDNIYTSIGMKEELFKKVINDIHNIQ